MSKHEEGGVGPASDLGKVRPAAPGTGGTAAPGRAAGAPPGWIESNQGIALLVAFVLIGVYVLPIYIIGLAAIATSGFQEPNFLIQWFGAFMNSADSTLNQYHKVLFPIMSALSVIAFKTRPDRRFLLLGLFVLLSFGVTVAVSVAFDVPSIQNALSATHTVDVRLSKLFFGRIQESLLMYLMMLLGIGVSNSIGKPAGVSR